MSWCALRAEDDAFREAGPEGKGVPNGLVPWPFGAAVMESCSGVPGRIGVAVAEV